MTVEPFSRVLASALQARGLPVPKFESKGRKVYHKTGFELDVAYDIISLAVQHGHRVYVAQCDAPFEKTVNIRIYASRGEVFYLKAYASNETQAAAAVDELIAISGASAHYEQGVLL